MKTMRYHFLAKLIRFNELHCGVELGVATGITTKYILENCPELTHLVAIDSWTEEHSKQWWTPKNSNTEENFRKKLRKHSNLEIQRGISWELAEKYKDGQFDFIFIDASHDYESVKKDILAWYPKIRKNGYITGHDIEYPGVLKAVRETLPDHIVTGIDNVWYHQKEK